MGKYDGYLICSDYDGTIYTKGKVTDENIEAIKYFQDNGGLFTLVTGRFPEYIAKKDFGVKPNTYIVGLNGAVIYDQFNDEYLYKQALPDDAFDISVENMLNCPEIQCVRVHSFSTSEDANRDNYAEVKKHFVSGEISKLIYLSATENSDLVKDYTTNHVDERFVIERSWVNGIEMLLRSSIKGPSVRRLANMLGDKVHTLICVGDYENDISMIKEADIGYAVENALPIVKANADRITKSVSDGSIAGIIEDILK